MRRRPLSLIVAAVTVLGVGALVPGALAHDRIAGWIGRPPAQSAPLGDMSASMVNVDFQGEFLGWALRDDKGALIGDNLTRTSSTESMIKTWLVADFLRKSTNQPDADDLERTSQAIRWSDDDAAEVIYEANGGNESIERMIQMCGLSDTSVFDGWWSRTQMSPRDAVTLGVCLNNGTAAGAEWTPWLLNEMRNVEGTTDPAQQWETRGGGRWGIIDGVPVAQSSSVAIKNGWTSIGSDGNWHLNCLAFTDEWTLSVMMRYPADRGLDYGAKVCQSIASQILS